MAHTQKILQTLLWAHYAANYQGFAIAVELPENDDSIVEVRYENVCFPCGSSDKQKVEKVKRQALSQKHKVWEHEQEIRIIHTEEKYTLEKPIVKVIMGHRVPENIQAAMGVICTRFNISLEVTGRHELISGKVLFS